MWLTQTTSPVGWQKDRFGSFMLFGSLASFFTPLAITWLSPTFSLSMLYRRKHLVKNKPPQRLTWLTVSTVFQRDETPCSSPEKEVAMLDGFHKDKTLPNARADIYHRKNVHSRKEVSADHFQWREPQRSSGLYFPLFTYVVPLFITNVTFSFMWLRATRWLSTCSWRYLCG